VGYLQFKGAGGKLAAIPETACSFHRHDVNRTGYDADDPSYNVVDPVEIHNKELRF
jgi:hypothetical protein